MLPATLLNRFSLEFKAVLEVSKHSRPTSDETVTGQILVYDGTKWHPGNTAGTGTVTSVGITAPMFLVTNSPITGAGEIVLSWPPVSQNAGLFGPTSGAGTPTFRAAVAADIPSLPESQITGLTTDLSNRALTSTSIIAGAGLTGGGDLSTDRTLSVPSAGISDSMIASAPTAANTPSTIVKRDSSGNFAAGTVTGNLVGNATNVTGIVGTSNGGGGGASASASFNNLNPMTTTGDLIIEAPQERTRRVALRGDSPGTTKNYLTSTGTGSAATAPVWGTIVAGDIPNLTESQITGLTSDLTARALVARNIATTLPLTGGANLSADLTLGINPCVASGIGHAAGAVPDPGSSSGTTRFLREDCTFAAPLGAGTVTSVALNR